MESGREWLSRDGPNTVGSFDHPFSAGKTDRHTICFRRRDAKKGATFGINFWKLGARNVR